MNSVGQKNSRTFAEASAEIQVHTHYVFSATEFNPILFFQANLQRHLDRQKSAKSNGNDDQDATGSEVLTFEEDRKL